MPGVLHDGGVTDVGDLLDDVELAQAVDLFFLTGQLGQVHAVFVVEVADAAQPAVDQAQLVVAHGGADATAAVVAGDEDVFDLSTSTAYWMTDRQLRSVCSTTLATLR